MGLIETSAALGACLLLLAVAIALDRRPYRPGKRNLHPDNDHRGGGKLGARAASAEFDGVQLRMSFIDTAPPDPKGQYDSGRTAHRRGSSPPQPRDQSR